LEKHCFLFDSSSNIPIGKLGSEFPFLKHILCILAIVNFLKDESSWAPVAHACNISYSGDGDQKDHGLKPAQANSSQDPISKNPITKNWAGGVAQGEDPEFKLQY
jgi:hypothetical protein